MTLHRHHRKRRSQGGDDSPENIMWVSPEFHNYIHANVAESYRKGWLVRGWDRSYSEPAEFLLFSDGWHSGLPVSAAAEDTPVSSSFPGVSLSGGSTDRPNCKRCNGTGCEPAEKKPREKPRKRKTWSVRVPDDAEDGAELLDSQVEQFKETWKDEMGWSDKVPKYYPLYAAVFKANQES